MGHEGRIGSCSDVALACNGHRWRLVDRQRCHVLETKVVDRRTLLARRLRCRSFCCYATGSRPVAFSRSGRPKETMNWAALITWRYGQFDPKK